MSVFRGPLAGHTNYLTYIALENCHDYFNLIELQKEKQNNNTPDKYKRFRYFLNAMESLNNVLEYFFHDQKDEEGWKDCEINNILGKMRGKHSILRDVEQIANAYKHCLRRNSNNLHASDLQSPILTAIISGSGVEVEFDFQSIEDEEIMGEAFRFWLQYHQDPDKTVLLPSTVT